MQNITRSDQEMSQLHQRLRQLPESTVRRILQRVDPQALEQVISAWAQACAPEDEPIVVDGKTHKSARRNDGSAVHLISALLHDSGAVIAQREVGAKHNEIPALRTLLAPLDVDDDRTVTANAMHTHTRPHALSSRTA